MRFVVEHPVGVRGYSPDFLTPAGLTRFARGVEDAGLDAICFTEHPAPSAKWLDGGGHETVDPIAALCFCAAVTDRVRLLTFLLVLPYRNPLLAAKQIATLDVLSGGRATIAVGAGYLRSEFRALGIEHDERNALLDEALDVLTTLWREPEFDHEGQHFTASGTVSVPGPVQRPHPPVWIGGNSRRARERVVRYGAGWAPLLAPPALARTTRTAVIDSVPRLAEEIAVLRGMLADAGRDPAAVDVCVQWAPAGFGEPEDRVADELGRLADAGVTWLVLTPPVDDVGGAVDALHQYGSDRQQEAT